MARPSTKSDLVEQAEDKFSKLWSSIDLMDGAQKSAPFSFNELETGKEAHWKRDQNLRDVLIHLYEWHNLLLQWVRSNQKGEVKSFLPAPYNWKTYGDMNIAFWQKHQGTSLSQSISLLKTSHNEVLEMIYPFTNDELFSKGMFLWTGGTTLGSYCVSATGSHYDWALKKIKKHLKAYENSIFKPV